MLPKSEVSSAAGMLHLFWAILVGVSAAFLTQSSGVNLFLPSLITKVLPRTRTISSRTATDDSIFKSLIPHRLEKYRSTAWRVFHVVIDCLQGHGILFANN